MSVLHGLSFVLPLTLLLLSALKQLTHLLPTLISSSNKKITASSGSAEGVAISCGTI